MNIPNIASFTFHTFKVGERFLEVFYGTIVETFYGKNYRLKVQLKNWHTDKKIVDKLNEMIEQSKKQKTACQVRAV